MGKSEYGLYSLGMTIMGYLMMLDLGFSNTVIRYSAKYIAIGDKEKLGNIYGMFFLLYVGVGIISVIIGSVLLYNIDYLFGLKMTEKEVNHLGMIVMLLMINLFFIFIFSVFVSIVTSYEKFVFQRIINIARIVLSPLLMIILLIMGYRAIGMVIVMTILNIIVLLLNAWYCFYELHINITFKKIEKPILKEISIYSFWIFIGVVVEKINWSNGQFLIGIFKGAADVAVYSIAMQLLMMYVSVSTAISGVYLPKITNMITNKCNIKEISDLFIRTGRLQFIVVIYILISYILFGKQFLTIWIGAGYEDVYSIGLILFIPLMVPLLQTIGIVILHAKNQVKFRSVTYLFVSIFGAILSIPLIKKYGCIGAAIGTSTSLFIGHIIIMNIYYKVKISLDISRFWREIFKMSIVPIIFSLLSYIIINNIIITNVYTLFFGAVIFSIIYIPLFWLSSMNEYEKNLIKNPFLKFKRGI